MGLEKKSCNALFWSPAGSITLLANLKGTAGQLEWVDVNVQQTIGEAEHFMCSDIEWDPTGRFVATSVSHWRHQMENGYILWSSHGRELSHEKKDEEEDERLKTQLGADLLKQRQVQSKAFEEFL